jgi:hypothetical protein
MDLLWNGQALGIYGPREGNDANHPFVPIIDPDTASPDIREMMRDFIELACPCELVSVRFRAGEGGLRGIWLDTSNLNIKALLDDGAWLRAVLARGWSVEVGQKHKEVVLDAQAPGGVSLATAQGRAWLPSFNVHNEAIPLLSLASLFSQPGPEVNRALLAAGYDLLDAHDVGRVSWAEWGAGYGNLSAGYATRLASTGWSSELEVTAAHWLSENAAQFFPEVRTARAVADETSSAGPGAGVDLWILDPPRPGFPVLLRVLAAMKAPPRYVLTYHCAEAGLAGDAALLREAHYTPRVWSSVDAFPATLFHEAITLWEKT